MPREERSGAADPSSCPQDAQTETADLLARIEAQINLLRLSSPESVERSVADPLQALRARQWVNPHLPIGWPTMPKGLWPKIIALTQKVARRLLRWYINPLVGQQNEFNDAAVHALQDIHHRLGQESARTAAERQTLLLALKRLSVLRATSEDGQAVHLGQDSGTAPLLMDGLSAYSTPLLDPTRCDGALQRVLLGSRLDDALTGPVLVVAEDGGSLAGHLESLGLVVQIPHHPDGGRAGADMVHALAATLQGVDPCTCAAFLWTVGLWRLDTAQALGILQSAAKALRPGAPIIIESIDPGNAEASSRWVWADPQAVRLYAPPLVSDLLQHTGFELVEVMPSDSAGVFAVTGYRSQD